LTNIELSPMIFAVSALLRAVAARLAHKKQTAPMKRTLTQSLVAALALSGISAFGSEVIEESMKKFHKGETALCKEVGAGTASASDLDAILKSYQAIAKETPPKGTSASWKEKCDALIKAVTALKGGDKSAAAAYKKAVNCKACHDVHKGK
jgi:hypothetical protein